MTGPNSKYTETEKEALIALNDSGVSYAEIAERNGKSRRAIATCIQRWRREKNPAYIEAMRAKRLERHQPKPQAEPRPVAAVQGQHLADYQRARRGFDVPAHKQDAYFARLIEGVPIAQAARELGLVGQGS